MNIINVEKDYLSKYEDLLLKKEALLKEAFQYETDYIKEFGDLIADRFNWEIECIKRKKIISYCQKIINKGEKPNQNEVDLYINETMKEYYDKLKDVLKDIESAKGGEKVSEIDLKKIKTIYYKIAKLIHPDTNPTLSNNEKALELWNRAVSAYKCNRLKDIEEIEVLVNQFLKSINYGGNSVEIPNLDEKISSINDEIERIYKTDPYQYKFLLIDEEAVREKKDTLIKEKEEFIQYAKELDKVIEDYKLERILS